MPRPVTTEEVRERLRQAMGRCDRIDALAAPLEEERAALKADLAELGPMVASAEPEQAPEPEPKPEPPAAKDAAATK